MTPHHYRGLSLLRQGRHAEALASLRQAREHNPQSLQVASDLAIALLRNDRGQEAAAVAEGMVALAPEAPLGHATLGMVHLGRGHVAAGEAAFRRAIELDPEDADTRGLLARAHLEGDRPEDALAAADAGLALDPENDLCLTFRARALLALGRFAESEIVSARLLQLDPEDSYSHCIRGEELLLAGHPDQAAAHFREALRLDPQNETARYQHAACLKARSPLFAWLLSGMIRLERLGAWKLAGIVVCVLVSLHLIGKALSAEPVWLPIFATIKLLAFAVVLLALFAHQIYDVLLWLDKQGRHALSLDEQRACRWFCACFVATGLCLWWGANTKDPGLAHRTALGFLFLCKLVSATYSATPGYVRRRMAALTIGTAIFHTLSPFLCIVLLVMLARLAAPVPLLLASLMLAYVAVTLGVFSENIRAWLERRRPDSA
jgi:tetratricopeptide (TPR) repeat protein